MSTFVEFNAEMVHFGPHKKKMLMGMGAGPAPHQTDECGHRRTESASVCCEPSRQQRGWTLGHWAGGRPHPAPNTSKWAQTTPTLAAGLGPCLDSAPFESHQKSWQDSDGLGSLQGRFSVQQTRPVRECVWAHGTTGGTTPRPISPYCTLFLEGQPCWSRQYPLT